MVLNRIKTIPLQNWGSKLTWSVAVLCCMGLSEFFFFPNERAAICPKIWLGWHVWWLLIILRDKFGVLCFIVGSVPLTSIKYNPKSIHIHSHIYICAVSQTSCFFRLPLDDHWWLNPDVDGSTKDPHRGIMFIFSGDSIGKPCWSDDVRWSYCSRTIFAIKKNSHLRFNGYSISCLICGF